MLFSWSLSCVQLFTTPQTVACHVPIHRISQARILEWVAISFSRGSSWPRDWTQVSHIGKWVLYYRSTREAHKVNYISTKKKKKVPFIFGCCSRGGTTVWTGDPGPRQCLMETFSWTKVLKGQGICPRTRICLTAHEKNGWMEPRFSGSKSRATEPVQSYWTSPEWTSLCFLAVGESRGLMWSSVFHPCPAGQCLTSVLGTFYVPSQPLQITLFPCNILWNKWWKCSTHVRLLSMFSALICLFVHHFSPKRIKAIERHTYTGTSLVVQWLRLYTFNAGTSCSIPGCGTKNLHNAWHDWIVKKKKKRHTHTIMFSLTNEWLG